MKTLFSFCFCYLTMFCLASAVYAQPGLTRPGANPPHLSGNNPPPPPIGANQPDDRREIHTTGGDYYGTGQNPPAHSSKHRGYVLSQPGFVDPKNDNQHGYYAANQPGFVDPGNSLYGYYGQYGFVGQSRIVMTQQAKTFAHRTPVIVNGSIVQAIGGDRYVFRDSHGEIIIKIGPKEWYNFGSNIGPSDQIEISGELHRDQRDWQRPSEIHARHIKRI
jgi:uncharacterized protein (TIGR00156 family)